MSVRNGAGCTQSVPHVRGKVDNGTVDLLRIRTVYIVWPANFASRLPFVGDRPGRCSGVPVRVCAAPVCVEERADIPHLSCRFLSRAWIIHFLPILYKYRMSSGRQGILPGNCRTICNLHSRHSERVSEIIRFIRTLCDGICSGAPMIDRLHAWPPFAIIYGNTHSIPRRGAFSSVLKGAFVRWPVIALSSKGREPTT